MNTLRNDLIKAGFPIWIMALSLRRSEPGYSDDAASMEAARLAITGADHAIALLNASEPTGSAEVDWSKAPEWAEWHAFDDRENGQGCWYRSRPNWHGESQQWINYTPYNFGWLESGISKPANLLACDSLTRRPGK